MTRCGRTGNGRYVLDGKGEPIVQCDLMAWGNWYQNADRNVCRSEAGDVTISTIFTGRDQASGTGPPVLWEVLVIGGNLDGEMDRCTGGRQQAKEMHARMVERVKNES